MGIPRKTYLTTLDDPRDWPDGDGAFIESLALLTGSVSAALRLAVKILRGCIAAGIVDYDVAAWQALAANDSNTAFGSERGIPGRRNTTSPEQGVPPRRVQLLTSRHRRVYQESEAASFMSGLGFASSFSLRVIPAC